MKKILLLLLLASAGKKTWAHFLDKYRVFSYQVTIHLQDGKKGKTDLFICCSTLSVLKKRYIKKGLASFSTKLIESLEKIKFEEQPTTLCLLKDLYGNGISLLECKYPSRLDKKCGCFVNYTTGEFKFIKPDINQIVKIEDFYNKFNFECAKEAVGNIFPSKHDS